MIYVLFSGKTYYADGGAKDFVGVFPTLEEARVGAQVEVLRLYSEWDTDYYWWHIASFDGTTLEVAEEMT